MKIGDLVSSSLESLWRTKARSLLTMLGIIIGVMSVILVLSIGESAQRYILEQISSFGSDTVIIANGSSEDEGQPTLFIKESLLMKDVRTLRVQPWVSTIVGKVMQQDQFTANGLTTDAQIIGTMTDEPAFSNLRVARGTFFSSASVDGHAREIVLGAQLARNAFGQEDPIGKTVSVSHSSFKIIGIMEEAGTKAFQNVDKQLYMPVTAALDLYNKKYLTFITLKSSVPIGEAKNRISILIRDQHNIDNPTDDPAKNDFHVHTQDDFIKRATSITTILQILLISIAAISLLVGGIGIMNMMYVAVTERIKEIGLRKSIGARQKDILGQFLIEAIMQTLTGGVIGIVLGALLSWIAVRIISTFQTGWTFAVSMKGIVLGLAVSTLIGLIFGYFPARRAAALHPIDALRVE